MSRRRRPDSLFGLIASDVAEMAKLKGGSPATPAGTLDVLALPGTWSVMLWRVANWSHERPKLRALSRLSYIANLVVTGADVHPGAAIGPGLVMPHPVGVCIAAGTTFGARARLLARVSIGGSGDPHRTGHPTFGDDVWVMDGARVMGPVTVGDRSIIGAGAMVASDVPPDMFVYGVRRSKEMRPLAEMGLEDHGGALPPRTVAPEPALAASER